MWAYATRVNSREPLHACNSQEAILSLYKSLPTHRSPCRCKPKQVLANVSLSWPLHVFVRHWKPLWTFTATWKCEPTQTHLSPCQPQQAHVSPCNPMQVCSTKSIKIHQNMLACFCPFFSWNNKRNARFDFLLLPTWLRKWEREMNKKRSISQSSQPKRSWTSTAGRFLKTCLGTEPKMKRNGTWTPMFMSAWVIFWETFLPPSRLKCPECAQTSPVRAFEKELIFLRTSVFTVSLSRVLGAGWFVSGVPHACTFLAHFDASTLGKRT